MATHAPHRSVLQPSLCVCAFFGCVLTGRVQAHNCQHLSPQNVFNVQDYGATGDGNTIDTPAINGAIDAANAAGGGIVEFPPGRYLSVSIHLQSISFSDCQVLLDNDDGRPAVIVDDGEGVAIDGLTADRGSTSPYDLGFNAVDGFCVTNSAASDGSELSIDAVDSSEQCPQPYLSVVGRRHTKRDESREKD